MRSISFIILITQLMDKAHVNDVLICKSQRNNSFCKYVKKQSEEEFQELSHVGFPQIKTLKMINKKPSRIPFLNLDDLRQMSRPKLSSLKHNNEKIRSSEKKETVVKAQDVSFLMHQCQLLMTKKNQSIRKVFNGNTKKQSLLPPITQNVNSSSSKFCQIPLHIQNSVEPKRKISKSKPHCKILLGRHIDFPFFANEKHQLRKNDRINTKQTSNPQNIELFDLDISRISQVEQTTNLDFISRESLQQIKIF